MDNSEAPTQAGAATLLILSDEDVARRFQTMRELTGVYGFSAAIAQEAIDTLASNSPTTEECINYILDHGLAPDQGGPVIPIDSCPHGPESDNALRNVENAIKNVTPTTIACCGLSAEVKPSASDRASDTPQNVQQGESCGATGEVWICLHCGLVFCSRYVHGHAVDHHTDLPIHSTHVSITDLSVWCHTCSAYVVTHNQEGLRDAVNRLEKWKFGENERPENI